MTKLQQAKRNIRLFVIVKIFGKRVFLPLTAIYFMDEIGLTLAEIGLIGSLSALITFLADIPTGVFADYKGKAASLRVGAALNICSTLIYALLPYKPMMFVAIVIESLGYAFLIGAGEALIHDSLEVRKKLSDYTKIVSRTQSLSLVVNAALLALVPMTYQIDPRLPFLIGTVAYSLLFIAALFMKDVIKHQTERSKFKNLRGVLRTRGVMLFALTFGIIGALYIAPSDLVNIAFKELGLEPSRIGWVFSVSALAGAAAGTFYHLVKRLSLTTYLLLDCMSLVLPMAAIYLGSLPMLVGATMISMSFWRYRRIYYQDKMLQRFKKVPKATLLSMLNNSESIHYIWIPSVLGFGVAQAGLANGFGMLAIFAVIMSVLFVSSIERFLRTR